jgi:hypothetical protein
MKTEIKKPEISHYIDYLTEKEEILNLQDKASYKGRNFTSLLGGYLIPKCEPFREMFRQKLKEFQIKYQYKDTLYTLLNIIKER